MFRRAASINGLNGFAYFNNADNFNELFTNNWDASGLTPDWAVDLEFTFRSPARC